MAAAQLRVDRAAQEGEAGAQEIERAEDRRRHPDQPSVLVRAEDDLLGPRLRIDMGREQAEALPEGKGVGLQLRVVGAPAGADLKVLGRRDPPAGRRRREAGGRRLAQKRTLTPARTARPL
jgi:hypothetical protein